MLKTDDIDEHIKRANTDTINGRTTAEDIGPFSIGNDTWPGISKLIEECGEVLQVCGKLIATGGRTDHWSGVDLRVALGDEIADLLAALAFVGQHNFSEIEADRIKSRAEKKIDLFDAWHKQYTEGGS